jgi:hypothetical protein
MFKQKTLVNLGFLVIFFGSLILNVKIPAFTQKKPKDKDATIRCEIVENRINRKFDTFVEIRKKQIESHQKIINSSNVFLEYAREQKLDIFQLENDIKTLREITANFVNVTTKYETNLEITRNNSCGKDKNSFLESLNKSRQDLIEVTNINQKIRKFVETDILSDIQIIKSQIK